MPYEIQALLGEALDLILDGGPSTGGPSSTVVDCTGEQPGSFAPGNSRGRDRSRPREALALLRRDGLQLPVRVGHLEVRHQRAGDVDPALRRSPDRRDRPDRPPGDAPPAEQEEWRIGTPAARSLESPGLTRIGSEIRRKLTISHDSQYGKTTNRAPPETAARTAAIVIPRTPWIFGSFSAPVRRGSGVTSHLHRRSAGRCGTIPDRGASATPNCRRARHDDHERITPRLGAAGRCRSRAVARRWSRSAIGSARRSSSSRARTTRSPRSWKRRARGSRTSTPRACRASATTAAASTWTSPRRLAQQRALALFPGAEHVNVQPHSGAQANMAAYFSVLQPGDRILGMNLAHGGHLTHGSPVNFSGPALRGPRVRRRSRGPSGSTTTPSRRIAREVRPKMVVAGASAYPRIIDFPRMAAIAHGVGALLFVDMAHIAGPRGGGRPPEPVPARGHRHDDHPQDAPRRPRRPDLQPRGPAARGRPGGLPERQDDARRADRQGGLPGRPGRPAHARRRGQGGGRSSSPPSEPFRRDQRRTVENAAVLAETLAERGARIVSGGTDNHLMLVDVTPLGVTGKEAEALLDEVGITVNKNAIPFDPLPPNTASGIRLGTPGDHDPRLRARRDARDRPDHHRRDRPPRRSGGERPPACRGGVRSPAASPSRACSPRTPGELGQPRPAAAVPADHPRLVVHRCGDRGPAGRRRCIRRVVVDRCGSSITRTSGGSTRGRSRAAAAWRWSIAFLLVGGGLVLFGGAIAGMPELSGVEPQSLVGLFGGAILGAVLGALDDRYDLRARWQFLGQLVLAGVAVATGITVAYIGNPFGAGHHPVRPAARRSRSRSSGSSA